METACNEAKYFLSLGNDVITESERLEMKDEWMMRHNSDVFRCDGCPVIN